LCGREAYQEPVRTSNEMQSALMSQENRCKSRERASCGGEKSYVVGLLCKKRGLSAGCNARREAYQEGVTPNHIYSRVRLGCATHDSYV